MSCYRQLIELSKGVNFKPVFKFDKMSESQYFFEIQDSNIGWLSNRNYDYGAIAKIDREQTESQLSRIVITFSGLKDIPEIENSENPPHFNIHFNRHLDNKFFIVIDPGHGGSSSGAVGPQGTVEKNVNLNITLKLKEYLSKRTDVEVLFTRETDRAVSLFERRRLSSFWDPDLFLSIHSNSARNKTVNQTEIY